MNVEFNFVEKNGRSGESCINDRIRGCLCRRYDANYCSGDCPMAFLPAYPNTHIVSLAEPPNNTGPCCAPRKLSEITMLYFDNEYQIVFSRLPGMVVEKCGCS